MWLCLSWKILVICSLWKAFPLDFPPETFMLKLEFVCESRTIVARLLLMLHYRISIFMLWVICCEVELNCRMLKCFFISIHCRYLLMSRVDKLRVLLLHCLVKLTRDLPIPLQWLHILKLTNLKSRSHTKKNTPVVKVLFYSDKKRRICVKGKKKDFNISLNSICWTEK